MNASSLRILYALPTVGHPRDSKRIAMLQNMGFQVEAVAFERKSHKGRMPTCSVEIVGVIDHGRYLKRMIKMMVASPSVRRAIKSNDVVYASGPDMALFCLASGMGLCRPIILEVGDVRDLQTADGFRSRLIRTMDKYTADSCHLLILQGVPLADRPLRIGYFGLLRCEESWQVLTSLAKRRPKDVEIVVAGYPIYPADLPLQAEKYSNVVYKGKYRLPDDLPSLYHGVDLTWVVYPNRNGWGFRWARTNRFYESCFYQKPMISRSGSADAVEIQRYGVGLIIENNDTDGIVDALSNITPEDMDLWRKNLAQVPPEVYLYTTEAEDIGKAIRDVVGGRIGSDG